MKYSQEELLEIAEQDLLDISSLTVEIQNEITDADYKNAKKDLKQIKDIINHRLNKIIQILENEKEI